jgi:hypothetical protein
LERALAKRRSDQQTRQNFIVSDTSDFKARAVSRPAVFAFVG